MFRRVLLTLALAPLALAAPPALRPVLVALPRDSAPRLLGGWEAGRWVTAEETVPRLRGGETYRVQGLAGAATPARGGRARSMGEPCEASFQVSLTPRPTGARFLTVTAAGFNPRPRPVRVLSTGQAVYRDAVRAELVRRGLKQPDVRLTGVTRADLNGDGRDEVLIEASRFTDGSGLTPPPVGRPGDYSLLLLRDVRGGRVHTTVLAAHVAPLTPYDPGGSDPMPMANLYRLAGLADLNGDGRLELLTFAAYYEGDSLAVSEWTPQGGVKTRLETGCGV